MSLVYEGLERRVKVGAKDGESYFSQWNSMTRACPLNRRYSTESQQGPRLSRCAAF